jgi:hypothetical protein
MYASIIRLETISELGTMLLVASKQALFIRSVLQLLVTVSVVPSSPIAVTLMMEAINSSVTSARTRARQHHIPEDGILQLTVN